MLLRTAAACMSLPVALQQGKFCLPWGRCLEVVDVWHSRECTPSASSLGNFVAVVGFSHSLSESAWGRCLEGVDVLPSSECNTGCVIFGSSEWNSLGAETMTTGRRMIQDWLQPHIVDILLNRLATCGTTLQDLLSSGHSMKAANVRCRLD